MKSAMPTAPNSTQKSTKKECSVFFLCKSTISTSDNREPSLFSVGVSRMPANTMLSTKPDTYPINIMLPLISAGCMGKVNSIAKARHKGMNGTPKNPIMHTR